MFVSSAKKNKYKKCKEPSKKAFFSFHNARRVFGCGGGGDANLVSRRAYSAPLLLLLLPQSALLPSPICPPLRLFPFRSQIDDGASSTAPSPPARPTRLASAATRGSGVLEIHSSRHGLISSSSPAGQ